MRGAAAIALALAFSACGGKDGGPSPDPDVNPDTLDGAAQEPDGGGPDAEQDVAGPPDTDRGPDPGSDVATAEPEDAEIATAEPEEDAEIATAEPEVDAEIATAEPEEDAEIATAEPEEDAEVVTAEPEEDAEVVTAEPEEDAEVVTAEPEEDAEVVSAEPEPEPEVVDPEPDPPVGPLAVLNEVLVDADTDTLLDPNGDGDLDATDDEFVEVLNAGDAALDLSGWSLVEEDLPSSPRHTFAEGTLLLPGHAIVVFGGGEAPEDVPGAAFVVAQNADPGFSFGLHLTDAGNTLRLLDGAGAEVASFAWGTSGGDPAPEDQSSTRFPDGSGAFAPHSEVAPDGAIFSPGMRVDGTSFGAP